MKTLSPCPDLPRFALSKTEAAASLGMSVDSFERYVQPHLKVLPAGRLRLFSVRELQRWVAEREEAVL